MAVTNRFICTQDTNGVYTQYRKEITSNPVGCDIVKYFNHLGVEVAGPLSEVSCPQVVGTLPMPGYTWETHDEEAIDQLRLIPKISPIAFAQTQYVASTANPGFYNVGDIITQLHAIIATTDANGVITYNDSVWYSNSTTATLVPAADFVFAHMAPLTSGSTTTPSAVNPTYVLTETINIPIGTSFGVFPIPGVVVGRNYDFEFTLPNGCSAVGSVNTTGEIHVAIENVGMLDLSNAVITVLVKEV